MLVRLATLVALSGFCAIAGGCESVPPHDWHRAPEHSKVAITRASTTSREPVPFNSDWQTLNRSYYIAIPCSKENRSAWESAVARLDRDAVVALTGEEVLHLTPARVSPSTGTARRAPDDRMRPYLVRGIAHGGTPFFVDVHLHNDETAIWVNQGTWNGENVFFAQALRRQVPCPVIVYLLKAPSEVFATAELGGDAILARQDLQP